MAGGLAINDDMSDESLMSHVRQGSHQAFSILVRRHAARFHAACYRMAGSRAEAEDMVQEAFLKLWRKPDIWREDGGARFTTWFYRILVNQNTDRLRRGKRMAPDDTALAFAEDGAASAESVVADREEQVMIEAAIASLPERQGTALNLCFYEGLSNAEAATAMGVKVKALESLIMRAKAGIRDYIDRLDTNGSGRQNNERKRYGTR